MAATSSAALTVRLPSEREIFMSRAFAAPRQLVYEAHTMAEHLVHWWIRKGSTLPVCEVDLRPGGAWRFVQREAHGEEHGFRGVYREVVPLEQLVFTFEYEGLPGHIALVTQLFSERGGMTTVTSTMRFDSMRDRDGMLHSGMEDGANETLDRLEAHLRAMANAPSEREIIFKRVFDAPRELVFDAWTDPEHLLHWWGPKGFTLTIQQIDMRPGGVWRFIMHGPDGRDYPNRVVYDEIARPERIVYSHGGDESEPVNFQVTATFTGRGGKTELTMRMAFPSAGERDRVVKEYGAIEGGNQTLDRLGERLAKMASQPGDLVITRFFDAPRSLVFDAWTKPEHLLRWWAPKDCTTPSCTVDLRVGGKFHFCMRMPGGKDIWGLGIFREVVKPERIVYTDSFADAQGNPVPPTHYGASAGYPPETLVTVTFADEQGKTKLTLRHSVPVPFVERDGMELGWNQMLDQLAEVIAPGAGAGAGR
jgi:uncharacterized protein YndB with AHSA1/START domain